MDRTSQDSFGFEEHLEKLNKKNQQQQEEEASQGHHHRRHGKKMLETRVLSPLRPLVATEARTICT
jgi:hypothetical protein